MAKPRFGWGVAVTPANVVANSLALLIMAAVVGAVEGEVAQGGELRLGYGITRQAFASGHILAMRRAVTSIGPAYTSVWHRDPPGTWKMWIDVEPMLGYPRYFGKDLQDAVKTSIQTSWPSASLGR